MLYWIMPTIRDVVLKIGGIADMVLPKPALPNAPLAPRNMARPAMPHRQLTRKARLDRLHTLSVFGVPLWQSPDAMHVVR